MSKDKQIEEMVDTIEHTRRLARDVCGAVASSKMIATDLYNAGYCKQSEEMENDLRYCHTEYVGDYGDICTDYRKTAEKLAVMGYRKQSEVKEAVEKLMSATDKVICEAKQEVAREIFEEIERVGEVYENRAETVCYFPNGFLAALKKKYTKGE